MSKASDPVFARIARRYDRINSVLSLGREQGWRKEGIRHLPEGIVLDLGSGTGAAREVFGGRRVIALDPVVEMLQLNPIECRVAAIGEQLPFPDETFDGVFSAYVFRNLTSIPETLNEIERVLKPGGRAVIIDLSRPRSVLARRIHRMGTAIVLPLVGALFAGAPGEYRYLHRTLDSLPPPEKLFSQGPLDVERVWRMGMNGFVYGAVLAKE
ncbi:MAG TPA: class I SAM-dependent methyltransferase [Acidimicrobiia bacterium]|nr:class I SAM-dependent methyltransferase [Acidimicrobiia bacterium]